MSMMLVPEDHWYPVLESHELQGKPLGVERFAQPLVFWRTANGQPHAHPDRCPHLGATLSAGEICEDHLTCPFHGIAFDAQGQCVHIPANGRQGKKPKGMALRTFEVLEAHGLIWLWRGGTREVYPEAPFFSELKTGWRYSSDAVEYPVHYTRAIENQLDVAHLAFVHRSTIGCGGRSFVDGPYVEADRQGIKVWVTNARDEGQSPRSIAELRGAAAGNDPTLDFLFPGIWLLNLGPRLKNVIAFVPISERQTRYYLRVYHRIRNPIIAKPFEVFMGLSNRWILNQDRRVVVTQTPASSLHAHEDTLIAADRAISLFRSLHARLLESDEGGRPQPTLTQAAGRSDE
jgi:phenylpropionate dioxygenase-like ring-hydroxylating dioxygenase large terminal subunit